MKIQIAPYLIKAACALTLAGIPLFAGDLRNDRQDLRQDYFHLSRQNADIRHDQRLYRDDLEDGRYRLAAREQRDLNHDYFNRERQLQDIRHDRRDIRLDRYDCR